MAITETHVMDLKRRAQRERNQEAIRLLRSWVEDGDEQEQRETFEALKRGLNENHSSHRTIYP